MQALRRRRRLQGLWRPLPAERSVEVVEELQAGGGPLLPVEVDRAVEAQRERIVHRRLEGAAEEALQ